MSSPDKPDKTTKPSPPAAPAEASKADESTGSSKDVVLLHSRTEDGQGVRALRARAGAKHLEVAEIRPIREGKPLQGTEVVSLRPRKEMPFVCDVDVQYDGREGASRDGDGPPKVANARYRRNWDRVFGRKARKRRLPPVDDSALN